MSDEERGGTEAELERLRGALAAEEAGARHWRDLALRRERDLASIKRRTSVRAILALDRRTSAVRGRLGAATTTARTRIGSAAVTAAGLASRGDLGARRRTLVAARDVVDRSSREPVGPRVGAVVMAAGVPEHLRKAAETEGVPITFAPEPSDIASAVKALDGGIEVVCLLAPTTEPVVGQWFGRLAHQMGGTVLACTATLIHPQRTTRRATEDDLLVRSAGLRVVADSSGGPVLQACRAGESPMPVDDEVVLASTGAVLAVSISAFEQCGGYRDLGTPDLSVLDLCLRLQAGGGEILAVGEALAFDHRPVGHRQELTRPVQAEGTAWMRLIDAHGPTLRRSIAGSDPKVVEFALTVASPSAKVADKWGDFHLAEALARSLERLGHRAVVRPLSEADSVPSRCADVHLVLRGLAPVRPTEGQVSVIWVISHPEDIQQDEIDSADLVLVASTRFAAELAGRTDTPVEVLLQATDPERFTPTEVVEAHRHDITVVGKSRDVLRPMVEHAIAAGLRPAIYGSGWDDLVDPALIVTDHVANDDLAAVYSSAGVVLNDHWETMKAWGFVSNRVFDVLACGTAVVSDHLPEVRALFGDLVPTWSNPNELGLAVQQALAERSNDELAEARRAVVLSGHTFDHRAVAMLAVLAEHRLLPAR